MRDMEIVARRIQVFFSWHELRSTRFFRNVCMKITCAFGTVLVPGMVLGKKLLLKVRVYSECSGRIGPEILPRVMWGQIYSKLVAAFIAMKIKKKCLKLHLLFISRQRENWRYFKWD
jgi:hypothetical protein